MKAIRWAFILLMLVGTGCGGHSAAVPPAPLTVDEWKELPPEARYEIDALERLKDGNPHLQSQEAWDLFVRNVLAPARRRELPRGLPARATTNP